ncbi:MAG: sigma 54-interacting transcriptional regulator [bacterium]|nr:sigma 54-interacting transcriptional regulator [bacterium]
MSLDLFNQISKVLNSNSDLIRSVNVVLMLLQDYLAVRNPCLLIRDNVINKFFIDIAPEIDELDKNRWNQRIASGLGVLQGLKLQHESLLYPGDQDFLDLPMPEDLVGKPVVHLIQPVIYRQQNLPLGLLSAYITEFDQVNLVQKTFKFLSDFLALSMVAKGFPVPEITDAEPEREKIPTILEGIVGQSDSLKEVAMIVKKVAASKATVLIRGESGTGKELFAQAIHNYSLHKKAPFVGVNCAALSDSLLESELFGHEKGAFTGATQTRKGRFELADGGTLFLDEIGDTSLGFQAKILRVLQEGQFERLGGTKTLHVDVRILCATNVDLEAVIAEGTFREDLYYRLNVITLDIPPLRERRDDVQLLVQFFLDRFNRRDGTHVRIREEDMLYLCGLDWPGNVRELENLVQSGFLMEKNGWFNLPSSKRPKAPRPRAPAFAPLSANHAVVEGPRNGVVKEEIVAIEDALRAARGVQVKAAKTLGISLRQLRYRIQKYNLTVRKIHL